jgi:hypothetical protein
MRAKLRDVLQNLGDPAWAEPIALAAGMMRGRTELVTLLYEEYKKRPRSDLQLLLAACLRDAELENFDFDPSYLIIQDEILGSLVDLASSRRAMT